MKKKIFLLLTTAMLYMSGSSFAEITAENIGSIGGWPDCIIAQGDYAFFFQGKSLNVMQIDGGQWTRAASLMIDVEPDNAVIHDNKIYAFARWDDSALQIYDIADPLNPAFVSEVLLETRAFVNGAAHGNYAYIAMEDQITVIDVTTGAVSAVTTPANDVFVSGGTAYVGHDDGITVFDLTDPAVPAPRGTATTAAVTCLYAEGTTVYAGCNGFLPGEKGLAVVNAADPQNPVQIGFAETKITQGAQSWLKNPDVIDVQGDYAYLGCNGSTSLFIFDVSDPANPQESGVNEFLVAADVWEVASMDVHGDFAYIITSGRAPGVTILDVSDPAAPAVDRIVDEPWEMRHIATTGDTLFLAADHALFIYRFPELQGPDPVLLGSDTDWAGFRRIFHQGDKLYGIHQQELHILDISDVSAVGDLGTYTTQTYNIREIFVLGDFAYLLVGDMNQGRLEIVDVSDPANPAWAGEYSLPGEPRDLFVGSGSTIAYVAYSVDENDEGFVVLDVTDPTDVQLLGTAQTEGEPSCIWVEHNLLCIGSNVLSGAGDTWYLDAFNVQDKTAPQHMAQDTREGRIWDVMIYENIIVASIPNNSCWFYYGLAYLYDNDADFREFDEFMLWLEEECPSPLSLFISYLYYEAAAEYMFWMSIDGYGCPDILDAYASYGLYLQIFESDASHVSDDQASFHLPGTYHLSQNYPNPFNPSTTIPFTIKKACHVSLKVYDTSGREVAVIADAEYAPGTYETTFRPQGLPTGTYVYRLRVGDFKAERKMTIVK